MFTNYKAETAQNNFGKIFVVSKDAGYNPYNFPKTTGFHRPVPKELLENKLVIENNNSTEG